MISFLREQGVLHYKVGDFELMLDKIDPPAVEPAVEPEKGGTEVASEPEIRKDGLTAEQQLDIYGREMP